MTSAPFRRVLLTNDDGIDAPGLAVLESVAKTLSDDIWVVAPACDQSGISHALSLHAPLRIHQRGPKRFAVTGTPGDCVVVAARQILQESPPTLLLSGINRGANLGVETVFSGTVGAAMTGLLLGLPSLALSQAFTDRQPVRWETARALAPTVIAELTRYALPEQACLNINFPDCPVEQVKPLMMTEQGRGLLRNVAVVARHDTRDLPYSWLHLERDLLPDALGSETQAIADHHISVTPLSFTRTNQVVLSALKAQRDPDEGKLSGRFS